MAALVYMKWSEGRTKVRLLPSSRVRTVAHTAHPHSSSASRAPPPSARPLVARRRPPGAPRTRTSPTTSRRRTALLRATRMTSRRGQSLPENSSGSARGLSVCFGPGCKCDCFVRTSRASRRRTQQVHLNPERLGDSGFQKRRAWLQPHHFRATLDESATPLRVRRDAHALQHLPYRTGCISSRYQISGSDYC